MNRSFPDRNQQEGVPRTGHCVARAWRVAWLEHRALLSTQQEGGPDGVERPGCEAPGWLSG